MSKRTNGYTDDEIANRWFWSSMVMALLHRAQSAEKKLERIRKAAKKRKRLGIKPGIGL